MLASILLVAAFLRLNRLDLIDFRFDQAYPLQYAQDIVRGHLWGVQPHGSVASHPAAYLYLMALPLLVTKNFMAIVAVRVLLDVAAVALTFLIGARYFNPSTGSGRVGLIAALLFAVAPWAIQFARNLWPVPQPLFSAVLLIGLLEIVQRRNPWGWAIAGWGIALTAGLHLGGAYVLPVALVAFVIGYKSFRLDPARLGLLPILLVAGAFLIHDAVHGFENLRAYTSAVGGGARFSDAVLQFTAWLSGGTGIISLTGAASDAWRGETPALQPLLDAAQVVWLAMACAWAAWRTWAKRDAATLIVLLWLVIPIGLQLVSSRPVMLQYLPVLLPVPFLLMAIAADDWLALAQQRSRVTGAVVGVLGALFIGALAFSQVFTTLRFTRFVETHNTAGGYGLPVHSALAARDLAANAIASGAVKGDVIVAINDFPTPWNEQAAILRSVMADVPYRFMSASGDGFVLRPDATHYIFAPGAEGMRDRIAAISKPGMVISQSVETQPGSGLRYTYVQLRESLDFDNMQVAPQATWDDSFALDRYRITRDGRTLRVETVLRVLRTPPEGADYHWFNHVFAGDDKIAQTDGQGVHPFAWRAGDLVYQSFIVELPEALPAGPLRLRVGAYTWPDVQTMKVGQPGQAPEDAVTLPVS
jgi:4-amino-4-deoxy-L-arabinose transferase-like glycosyltransferase